MGPWMSKIQRRGQRSWQINAAYQVFSWMDFDVAVIATVPSFLSMASLIFFTSDKAPTTSLMEMTREIRELCEAMNPAVGGNSSLEDGSSKFDGDRHLHRKEQAADHAQGF